MNSYTQQRKIELFPQHCCKDHRSTTNILFDSRMLAVKRGYWTYCGEVSGKSETNCSWSLKRRRNFPLLLSTRCHLSFFSSCSLLLSPLICKILPSSTSTLTSSFFNPGRSTLKTWASGVSFQSTLVLANWDVSRAALGTFARAELRKPSSGSHVSRENGSQTLVFRPPKKLGMRDIFGSETECFCTRKIWECFET